MRLLALLVGLLTLVVLAPSARSAVLGDVNGDGRVDAGDLVLATRIVQGTHSPTPAQLAAANVAPLGAAPGSAVGVDDLLLFGRALEGADVDGDGLSTSAENAGGASPFLVDSDGDGLEDAEEIQAYLTLAGDRDTDDDGVEDGDEVDLGLNPVASDFSLNPTCNAATNPCAISGTVPAGWIVTPVVNGVRQPYFPSTTNPTTGLFTAKAALYDGANELWIEASPADGAVIGHSSKRTGYTYANNINRSTLPAAINADLVWTKGAAPGITGNYAMANLTVNAGATLVVMPGATLTFAGNTGLTANGGLVLHGEPGQRLYDELGNPLYATSGEPLFDSTRNPVVLNRTTTASWTGIVANLSSRGLLFEYVDIGGAVRPLDVIGATGAGLALVRQSILTTLGILGSPSAIRYRSAAQGEISDSQLVLGTTAGGAALSIESGSNPLILRNQVQGPWSSSIYVANSSPEIRANVIGTPQIQTPMRRGIDVEQVAGAGVIPPFPKIVGNLFLPLYSSGTAAGTCFSSDVTPATQVNIRANAGALIQGNRFEGPAGAGGYSCGVRLKDTVTTLVSGPLTRISGNEFVRLYSAVLVLGGVNHEPLIDRNVISECTSPSSIPILGYLPAVGIVATGATRPRLINNSVENCNYGFVTMGTSAPQIRGNFLSANGFGIGITQSSSPQINDAEDAEGGGPNLITLNGIGVSISGDNLASAPNPAPVIRGNAIYANWTRNLDVKGLYTAAGAPAPVVDVSGNYWGTTNDAEITADLLASATAPSTAPVIVYQEPLANFDDRVAIMASPGVGIAGIAGSDIPESYVSAKPRVIHTGIGQASRISFAIVRAPATVDLRICLEQGATGCPTGSPNRVFQQTISYDEIGIMQVPWDGRARNAANPGALPDGAYVDDEAYVFELEVRDDSGGKTYNPGRWSSGFIQSFNILQQLVDPYHNVSWAGSYTQGGYPARVRFTGTQGSVQRTYWRPLLAGEQTTFVWNGRGATGAITTGPLQVFIPDPGDPPGSTSRLGLKRAHIIVRRSAPTVGGDRPPAFEIKTQPHTMVDTFGQVTRLQFSVDQPARVTVKILRPGSPAPANPVAILASDLPMAPNVTASFEWRGYDPAQPRRLQAPDQGTYHVHIEAVSNATGKASTALAAIQVFH